MNGYAVDSGWRWPWPMTLEQLRIRASGLLSTRSQEVPSLSEAKTAVTAALMSARAAGMCEAWRIAVTPDGAMAIYWAYQSLEKMDEIRPEDLDPALACADDVMSA